VFIQELGDAYLADSDVGLNETLTRRPLQVAACADRIGSGPREGQKVDTLQAAMPRNPARAQALCASHQGFILHAAGHVAGPVGIRLQNHWRSGTTYRRCNEQPPPARWPFGCRPIFDPSGSIVRSPFSVRRPLRWAASGRLQYRMRPKWRGDSFEAAQALLL